MKTLLQRAAELIAQLDQHEGAEGWSDGMSVDIDIWQKDYRNAERARIRTFPTVAWHTIPAPAHELSWVEVLTYRYQWSEGIAEGWGHAWVYYDAEALVFYRKMQNGYVGHGKLTWHKGEYQS